MRYRTVTTIVAAALLVAGCACSPEGLDQAVASGSPPTSSTTTTARPYDFAGESEALEQALEHAQFVRAAKYAAAVAEAERIEAERLEAERRHAAEHAAQEAAERAERERRASAQQTAAAAPAAPTGSVWDRLAECESHGEWDYGPHSGWGSGRFEGGLQFHPATWDGYKPAGYPEAAYQASREQQIVVGQRVQAAQGWGAWPDCSRKLGLR